MAFTDKLLPGPFRTVFGMHRLEDLLLSDFDSLSTIKPHSAFPSCTNEEIDRFTFTLTFFKPQVYDSIPVEVQKSGGPPHSYVRVIRSLIPWLLVTVDSPPFLPSTCWEPAFPIFFTLSVGRYPLLHSFKGQSIGLGFSAQERRYNLWR